MKPSKSKMFRFSISSITALLVAASPAQVSYKATVIGNMVPPNWGAEVDAYDINDLGQVVGEGRISSGVTRAFLWDASSGMLDIVPGGFDQSTAYSISNSGYIAGFRTYSVGSEIEAFRWDSLSGFTVMSHLPGKSQSFAYGVNDAGVVVGGSGFGTVSVPFIWDSVNGTTALGDLAGGSTEGIAYAINNTNQVVGYSSSGFGRRAFKWTPSSGMIDLGDLPGGSFESMAYAINDSGAVTGWTGVSAGQAAFKWDPGTGMQQLPMPGGTSQAYGYARSSSGAIVGKRQGVGFLWTAADGTQEVTPLIQQPVLDGWTLALTNARSMNSSGWIVGLGSLNKFVSGQWLIRRQGIVLVPQTALSGTVTLTNFVGSANGLPLEITVRNFDDELLVDTLHTTLDAAGHYSVVFNRLGTFRLGFKVSHWLRKEVMVTIATSNGTISAALVNGDIDNDNEIGIGDYSILSVAYNSQPGGGNWNSAADLNGDVGVDIADFSILSTNYGMVGD